MAQFMNTQFISAITKAASFAAYSAALLITGDASFAMHLLPKWHLKKNAETTMISAKAKSLTTKFIRIAPKTAVGNVPAAPSLIEG